VRFKNVLPIVFIQEFDRAELPDSLVDKLLESLQVLLKEQFFVLLIYFRAVALSLLVDK